MLSMIMRFLDSYLRRGGIESAKCLDCGQTAKPRREISTLNLLLYVILGVVSFFVLKALSFGGWSLILAILITVGVTFINVKLTKPKCFHCRSYNITVLSDDPKPVPAITEEAPIPETEVEATPTVNNETIEEK